MNTTITAKVHPSSKTMTVTVPINAPSAPAAQSVLEDALARSGRRLISARVIGIEGLRPFSRVAINVANSTECYLLRAEYTVVTK